MDQPGTPRLTRRDALRAAAGVCGLALLASGASSALAAPAPRGALQQLSGGRVKVALPKVPALRRVGGVATIGSVKGTPVAVVQTATDTYIALDLRCTHQGVTVTETATGWRCPAHGSTFASAGRRTGGPASGPLRTVRLRRQGRSLVVG